MKNQAKQMQIDSNDHISKIKKLLKGELGLLLILVILVITFMRVIVKSCGMG